ncbi:MAG: polyphosphate kinase 2 [SAR86 cluster bacterium SAR86B]|uniref:Polyphosphate kinase 2 n=1 Tax=SAR86 cluster bacterium SAR86B TaxID=1123867 RepID=J4V6I4_9GAMM|nr:MAG: polyphosphate kinase 2 [SAR86 cluster bacterium SAR86B]
MDFKKYMVAILILTFSANIFSTEKECKAKKIQLMKPLFPSVNVSGYTIIEFDVDQNGKIQKPRSIESKCLLQKRGSDDKEFKNCGVFIYESIAASRYIKYTQPTNSKGSTCSLKNETHKYTFINRRSDDLKYFKEISSKINSDFKNMEMTTPTPLKNPGDLKRQK